MASGALACRADSMLDSFELVTREGTKTPCHLRIYSKEEFEDLIPTIEKTVGIAEKVLKKPMGPCERMISNECSNIWKALLSSLKDKQPDKIYAIENEDRGIEGFCSVRFHESFSHIEIEYLASHPKNLDPSDLAKQVKKIGTHLLNAVKARVDGKAYRLVYLDASGTAEGFYERAGFIEKNIVTDSGLEFGLEALFEDEKWVWEP